MLGSERARESSGIGLNFQIKNERWDDVEFKFDIVGSTDRELSTDVKIGFKKVPAYASAKEHNEMILQLEPKPRIEMGITIKKPGASDESLTTSLISELSHENEINSARQNSLESNVFDMICDKKMNFLGQDDLEQISRITESVFKELNNNNIIDPDYN